MRLFKSLVLGMVLLASTLTVAAAGKIELKATAASNANQLDGEISNQLELIETASRALSVALSALAQAQEEKPDRDSSSYWTKDKDGDKAFMQQRFDADMSKWQSRINLLTNKVNQAQTRLAGEESKLAALQSKMGGAVSSDNRRRMDALERESRRLKRKYKKQ